MLTQNEIKQITLAADVLQKWRSYVTKKGSDDLSCHIALLASVETTIDQAMDVLLTKNPKLGQDIKSKCDKLLSGAKLVEDLIEVNATEARLKEIELLAPARRLISRFQQIAQNAREETEQNRETTIVAIIISLILVFLFELLVYFVPITWVKNHPNSYGLQGSIIFLIPCLIVGLFKPQSRKLCWRVAAIAFVVLFLSLLGGPANNKHE